MPGDALNDGGIGSGRQQILQQALVKDMKHRNGDEIPGSQLRKSVDKNRNCRDEAQSGHKMPGE